MRSDRESACLSVSLANNKVGAFSETAELRETVSEQPASEAATAPPRMFAIRKTTRDLADLMVMLLAGVSESIGLALFVPIIEMMNGENPAANAPVAWLDSVIRALGISGSFPILLTGVTLLVVGAFALTYVQTVLLKRAQYQCVKEVRHELFQTLLKSDWHHLSGQPQGEVVNNLLIESQRYAQSLAFEVQAAALAILIGAYLTMGGLLSPEMLGIVFVIGIVVVMAAYPLMKRAKIFGIETHEANRAFSFLLTEVFRGLKLIRVTGSEGKVTQRFDETNEELRRVFFASERNGALINLVVQSLPVIGLTIVIGIAFLVAEIAASVILVFLLIVSRLSPRLAQLQQLYNQYHLRSPTLPALDRMIEASREMPDQAGSGIHTFDSLSTGIRFQNVWYQFPGDEDYALSDISFEINRGETIALVGGSGAGKSTLVDMLVALRQPTRGRIEVHDTELSDIDPLSWRRQIGYVTQEITLFNDTLRNNLTFVDSGVSDEVLQQTLRAAQLEDLVKTMPDGLDTILGENGIRLSGGQRQRLALARALVSKPQILLLDEATSALDPEIEHAIKDTIEEVAKDLTVLIVSHRLSTVLNADRIYVVQSGRIVEQGTYETLLAADGMFAKLYRLQSD